MFFLLRQVRHLTRYFAVLGVLVFGLYWTNGQHSVALLLIGPPIFLANFIKSALSGLIEVNWTNSIQDFGVLLPVTLLYYTILGFLIKKLWNERGFARSITLAALLGFLVFIHFMAWKTLTAYFKAPF